MAGAAQDDALARWLSGGGPASLDFIAGEMMAVILVMDRQLTTRYINQTAVAGLTRPEVLGKRALDFLPPGYKEQALDVYTEVLRTGMGQRFETMYQDEPNGTLIWDVRVTPIRERPDGETIGLVAITTNVTEQRKASADRDRFFSLSLDMLLVVTREGRLKRINSAFCDALGHDAAELDGKLFDDLVHPEDRAATRQVLSALLGGQPTSGFENRVRRRDGEHRTFAWRATADPVTGDIYGVARDVTNQRAIEAQLLHAQKMDAIGKLAGGVAHDFNNLMQVVLVQADLGIAELEESSPLAENLREIATAGRRAADLTKQLLAFSRRQPTQPLEIDLNARIAGLMTMLRRLLPSNIAMVLNAAHDLHLVSADPTQLEQVVVNLCVNARDAMENGGKLTIETANVAIGSSDAGGMHPWAPPGRFVLLRVSDTGAGMAPDVQDRAFEPFFTTKGHRGAGLGLSTVYGIVQQHGGVVRVRSALGDGSTFEIYLPATQRAASASAGLERDPKGPASSSSGAPSAATILLTEDEEVVRKPVARLLEAAGYRTLEADNGLEALRVLQTHDGTVDLVLLDMLMPELDGPDTWRLLQRLRPDLRVLFASGYAESRELERLPAGAEVVQKPFLAAELLSRIRRKLGE